MQKQTISNILEFMKRATLQGSEVPVYTQCIEELIAEYKKEEPKIETKEENTWKWD